MDAVEHLRLLRIFHFIMAGMQLLGILVVTGSIAVSAAIGLPPVMIAVYAVGAAIMIAAGILNLMAGLKLPSAGRNLSITAAIIALLNAPLGTAFGIYALLVHFKFVPEAQS